jgi:hypothetical protein
VRLRSREDERNGLLLFITKSDDIVLPGLLAACLSLSITRTTPATGFETSAQVLFAYSVLVAYSRAMLKGYKAGNSARPPRWESHAVPVASALGDQMSGAQVRLSSQLPAPSWPVFYFFTRHR